MVSIIIPVYNVEEYIEECLKSILAQTYKDIELLIVDDGSTDNSLGLIREYENKFKKIRIFTQQNKGVSEARNLALNYVSGEFVLYIDPDDFLEPNMIEKMVNKAEKYNSDITICGYYLYYSKDNANNKIFTYGINENKTLSSLEVIDMMLNYKLQGQLWNKLFKKDLLINNNFKFEIGNINFFNAAVSDLDLSEEEREKLAELIDTKSLKSLEDYLEELNVSEDYKAFFKKLPWLFGGEEVLAEGKKYAFNNELKKNIEYLESLANSLKELGYGDMLTFDLGMVPGLNYYTGIIFRGYFEGVGVTVLSGGRYDNLISQFGRDIPAVGFSIKLDSLLGVIEYDTKKPSKYKIYYGKGYALEAIKKAKLLRDSGHVVELIPKEDIDGIESREELK